MCVGEKMHSLLLKRQKDVVKIKPKMFLASEKATRSGMGNWQLAPPIHSAGDFREAAPPPNFLFIFLLLKKAFKTALKYILENYNNI